MVKKYQLRKLGSTDVIKPELDESAFQINYKNTLNPAQYEAVSSTEGAYLVIAGAGTGKTRTLVYRVARLVEMGTDPQSILLLTFTRKAANEMMNRAALLLDNRCSKINGGTFHSFANTTLRKYGKAIGIDPSFTILDQGDSEDVINLIRSRLNITAIKKRFPTKQTIFRILSFSVNTGRSVGDIIAKEYPHFIEFVDPILDIQKVYASYKQNNSLLDYDDLLVCLNRFLNENSTAAKSFLSTIKYVMVDEYQDTNKIQAEIVQALARYNNNVMVVGDDSQSIYSFRGADFKNIIAFPELFGNVKVIKLEENYRSTQEILNLANYIIEGAVEKFPKFLFTRKHGGELPAIISAANENMQSRFIVDRILELREEGVPLKEIAVLFRSSYSSFDLEIELSKANIPFIKVGGMKFVETAHVKDVLAFLRIASNPKDLVSWLRVLLLHEGIGPKTAQKILDEIAISRITIKSDPEALVSQRYNNKLTNLFILLNKIHTKQSSPTEKAELVIEYYYPLFKEKYDDFNKRKKDLDILLNITQNYRSLDSLLADMALDPPRDSVVDIDDESREEEYVTLSTIHSAKGLEWHSLFIIHAMEGFFPISQAFDDLDAIEEERRLMYVASTRAKQNLYITYPMAIFDREKGFTFAKVSRFIAGVSEQLAEEWLLEE